MYRILAVDSGVIDCEMMKDVLTKKLEGPIEFISVVNSEKACEIMKESVIDLLIADIPQTTAYINNLVWTAYSLHREVQVILTSVKSEEKILSIAYKLDVAGYLLKPFQGDDLIKIVRPLEIAAKKAKVSAGQKERKGFLDGISASIEEYQYKKSIEIAKEYIDFLYDSGDNMSHIRTKIVEFLTDIASLAGSHSTETQKKLSSCIKQFRYRYDLQSNRFEVCSLLEEMMDIIFVEMEQYQLYHDDDIKKVLNYIDRNIKNNINLNDAAEYINMSPSYFSKFFKKHTGINFITYVTDRKIELAKEMLKKTSMPIINIAYELSYNETNYFSKAFKRKVGVTPTEYRETHILDPK